MTIKVCKEKTRNRLKKLGLILWWSLQIALPTWFIIGLIQIMQDDSWGILGITVGGFLTAMLFFILLIDGNNTILHEINKKIKLFEWNRDC